MANSKGASTIGSMTYHGKNSLLPPKIPFPSISPSYTEYIPSSAIAPKSLPKPRDGNSHHQRTSSESFLIEEQPSWLDDLLNEPDTPVRKGGHRRSSSDSFAYNDTNKIASMNYAAQDDNNKFKNISPSLSWGSQDFNIYSDMHHSAFYADPNPCGKNKNKPWVTPPTLSAEKKDVESGQQDPKGCFGKKEPFHLRSSASETDTKRAKQQFAQRSRVRKLQYIAELERNVYALQAEGSEVSAELEFLNQQNLILNMENKTLKQRLESLTQEQLIKYLEQDVLEREAGRLRSLYQQQNMQQPQQQQISSSVHRRAKSRDFDQQFANLSLKHKETNPSHDSFSSHI
ncbi:hypothetical protein ABFS82_14G089500 [Erythranthe guttata]|uniref:uncharacterized protein At4g06598 n=1 Tax=Erythranthe guttata TaxID=4155 RepID=UPI00064D913E|nr:PREDICTED: uncharacterized protein At4g06598 [Erythranthe guttata]|eukprot:XP_012849877.1 PREDICTED: uncharacterized protein At4g06598 [Erythranthe guttata]